jgi:hypothetical protein
VLVNYAHMCCANSQKKNCEAGLEWGMDECRPLNIDFLDAEFKVNYSHILDQERGVGYWLWKPYIIGAVLDTLRDGDYLFYMDSGSYLIADVTPLIDIVDSLDGVLLFQTGYKNSDWTKKDTFVLMDCDIPKCTGANQLVAAFVMVKKNSYSVRFIRDWLEYCKDERILTDLDNTMGSNYQGFRDHRHDQSVLTTLMAKNGLPSFRDPSQWGNVNGAPGNGSYPQLVHHSRQKS